ncbi:unnamed protein product [Rotaria sp. Silwood2]|nr:unnamed protein product [Rotaria sp. Silwood2]CAF2579755.1 unnamed protein product [Rotaria sp. Silwood2]CAF3914045.1 unnamed protein product [Rotaria sp. Silwood2]
MPLFKKKPTADKAVVGGGDSSMFDITLDKLKELMDVRGNDLMEKLNSSEYNGVKGLLEKLKVDGNKGLDSNNEQDLEQRRTAYGKNEIPPKPMKTFLRLCWDALHDMLLVILLICAIASVGLSFYKPPQEEGEEKQDEPNLEWIEGVAILVAVLVVVLVTAVNDWRKERQFRGLQNKIDKDQQTSVVRDSRIQQIPISELVVGDLCFIKYGDLLPADGLIVQSSDLKIDESSLTGETDLVKKNEKEDVGILSGTNVMEGSGRMLIVGVGLNSQVGRIMSLLGATDDDSKKKKKDKKKNKKNENKKNENKKPSKLKSLSSTKVSPDKSKKNENDHNIETVHEENEKNQSTTRHSRVHKLPALKQTNNDEHELKPTKKETNNDEHELKSTKKETNNDEHELKSTKKETNNDEYELKPTKKETNNNNEQEKKPNSDDKQKKKSTTNDDNDKQQDKQSDGNQQKQPNNQHTTESSVKQDASNDNKNKSEDKQENSQNVKEDPDQKPAGLAGLAAAAENGDNDENESNPNKHKSVLQEKLTRLALYIGYLGMAAAFLTLVCLIIRFCITNYVIKKQKGKAADASYFISFLIQAITVVVVSVPEGLPLAVTLALAYAVRKMMTDNNLVRHLDACETMGNASTICSDKTGTLTTNRMTAVQCYITGRSEAKQDEGGLPKQIGNKTECALLDLVQKWNGSYNEIRGKFPEDKLVKVYTFNSARKMMSTVIQRDEGYRLYTKGASEMVLTKCKSIIGEDNQPKDLNDDEKNKIGHDIIEKMANDGLRTICITYKDLGKETQNWDDEDNIVNDLTCIAIVGIEDPVRKEVPEAIEKCQKAGVVVRMVTGDNIMTARSIATKCGIIKPNDDFLVLEGKEFNKRIRDSSGKISQEKLDEVWPKLRVLARSSPQDKYNLVNGIVESRATQHREVVAVTGDGTNDGPALKRADVGFAMGIQGTDVAKQASDIILTDDNFSSIVKAMMWGRNVYDCIAKFLQFQLTANLSAGVISVISAAAISSVPLRAVQMLWVNLVMDTLASLALATEPPTEALLKRKPYGRTKTIISPLMLRNILGQSLYQLVIMFIILYAGQYFLGVESTVEKIQKNSRAGREISAQFTMVFNAFVLMTLFNEINARKLHGERNVFKGIFSNPFFYGIWLFCFAAQILIVTFGDKVFSCARLDIKQWAWSLLFGVGSLIWQQILLCIPVTPFSKCFSALYRICCPCCYKKKKTEDEEEEEEEEEGGETEDEKADGKRKKKQSVKMVNKHDRDATGGEIFAKYSTIGQLTNATVVTEPPPAFARYMLRKSVDRLNSEFRVIVEFRSRLEEIKEKRHEESLEHKRHSQGDILDV